MNESLAVEIDSEVINTDKNKDFQENQSTFSNKTYWDIFGFKFPKAELVFFVQSFLIYVVVIVSLFNLSYPNIDKNNDKLWIALLSSSVGYLLPNPSFKNLST